MGADDQLGSPNCVASIDGCPSRDLAVLNATLQDPQLQAGLAAQTVFGVDSRAMDGEVRRIRIGDASFFVGAPCGGASGCVEIPPAVSSLVAQLQVLDAIQMSTESCVSVFPDGTDF